MPIPGQKVEASLRNTSDGTTSSSPPPVGRRLVGVVRGEVGGVSASWWRVGREGVERNLDLKGFRVAKFLWEVGVLVVGNKVSEEGSVELNGEGPPAGGGTE